MRGVQELIRRGLDILVSLLGIVALSLPLIVIAILVRGTSQGPALFGQMRVGKNGKEFRILKFRTMRLHADGAALTVGEDARVTGLGRTLRKLKLDELPQLFNVLRGDMSLVGPRPEVPQFAHLYPEQERVWSVRPGITDPTAIRFRNESALLATATDPERYYIETILPEKVKGYLEYLDNRGLLYDMRVLLETVWRVLVDPTPEEDSPK